MKKEKTKQAEIDIEKSNVNKTKRDCIVSWTEDQQIYNIINPFNTHS